jgi:hypothetical protein
MLPVILVQSCGSGALIAGSESRDYALETAGNIVMICFSCFTFIYAVIMGVFIPAAIGNYAATGEVGAGFRFGEIFRLVKAAPAAYLMVLVGGFLAAMITFIGLIACIIGVFLTAAYASAINAHLMGQAYYEAKLVLGGNSDELEQVALNSL